MKKSAIFLGLSLLLTFNLPLWGQSTTQESDARAIREIYDLALTRNSAYDWLYHLSKDVGGRLAGSPGGAGAVEYTRLLMDTLGFDTVYLQPCLAPVWERGEPEQARIVNSRQIGSQDLNVLALGHSVGTGAAGLTAEVIEVQSLDEVEQLGRAVIEGKIVFYNRPMDPTQINTFAAYGGAVDQRVYGASKASEYGAVAAVVRSMTTRTDDVPHTGTMAYAPEVTPIPGLAISTRDADLLSRLLEREPVQLYLRTTCRPMGERMTYNVVGEKRGTTHPDEIILVGGHLDAWDIGEGAHDDGAGCVQSLGVIELLRQWNYTPQRSLRCVMFMNEESGLAGGRAYWKASNADHEFHLAAIESDRGGFTPRGFTCEGDQTIFKEKFQRVYEWLPLLEPYGLSLSPGGSGADISGLKSQKGLLFGLYPDSQRYFDYHHTAIDTFEAVNERELHLGVAAMASLVYLLDTYGL